MHEVHCSPRIQKVGLWLYKCFAHCRKNKGEDSRKPKFTKKIKQSLYLVKIVRNKNSLHKIFAKTRWSSINLMFCGLKSTKCALVCLEAALYEREKMNDEERFNLPGESSAIVSSYGFWSALAWEEATFDIMYKCNSVFKRESATILTAIACVLLVCEKICGPDWLDEAHCNKAARIWRSHYVQCTINCALLQSCFSEMWMNFLKARGAAMLQFDNSSFISHCYSLLSALAGSRVHLDGLPWDYFENTVLTDTALIVLRDGA